MSETPRCASVSALRPVYHHREDRIRAHVQLCWLALLLATAQIHAGFVQCDLHRGIAAALPAPKVFFSPFPLARTCVVVAAKAWSVSALARWSSIARNGGAHDEWDQQG